MNKKAFDQMTDEAVVLLIQSGDKDAMSYILNKYKQIVRYKARGLYIMGGDSDDLLQEGMIGLFEAISDYSPSHESSFMHFAQLCINRQIYTAIEASRRKKHSPLNSYVSLSADDSEDDPSHTASVEEILPVQMSAEDQFIGRENSEAFLAELTENLSPLEKKVMDLYLSGEEYTEIAEELHRSSKSIDNALQRIRSKARVLSGNL